MVSSTPIALLTTITILVRLCNGQQGTGEGPAGTQGAFGLTQGAGFNKPEFCGDNGENCVTIDQNVLDETNDCSRLKTCIIGVYLNYDQAGFTSYWVVTLNLTATIFQSTDASISPYHGTHYAIVEMMTMLETPYLQFECSHDNGAITMKSFDDATPIVLQRVEVNLNAPKSRLLFCAFYLNTGLITQNSRFYLKATVYSYGSTLR